MFAIILARIFDIHPSHCIIIVTASPPTASWVQREEGVRGWRELLLCAAQ